jgi:hypothetical protein
MERDPQEYTVPDVLFDFKQQQQQQQAPDKKVKK